MKTQLTFTLLASLALVVASGPAAAAPTLEEQADKIVLRNDVLVAWFEDKSPSLKLALTSALTGDAMPTDAFGFAFLRIVEYRDLDANGLAGEGEILATLDLADTEAWQIETASTNDAAVLNLSLAGPVTLANGGPNGVLDGVPVPSQDAAVTLTFTLRDADIDLDLGNATLALPTTALHYKLAVDKWPAADPATSRLALEILLHGEAEKTLGTGTETATVATNGTDVGSSSWSSLAKGKGMQGADVEVPVKSALAPIEAEGEEHEDAKTHTKLVLTYDAPGVAMLAHEGSVGLTGPEVLSASGDDDVSESLKDVPGAGALGVLVAAVAASLVTLRRSR